MITDSCMPTLPSRIAVVAKCVDLQPSFGGHPTFLGVQRELGMEQIVAGATGEAKFDLEFRVQDAEGVPNFLGPYAQGTKVERFFYLAWGTGGTAVSFGMFRRLKVHLSHLTVRDILAAAKANRPLEVTLNVTDKRGEPRCASVREGDPGVTWR